MPKKRSKKGVPSEAASAKKACQKIQIDDTTASLKTVVYDGIALVPNNRCKGPNSFAIRRDGSYVYALDTSMIPRHEADHGIFQTGPNGLALPSAKAEVTSRKSGFRDGNKDISRFFSPVSVAVCPKDGMSLFIVDAGNSCVRRYDWATNTVKTHSGVGVEQPKIGDEVHVVFEGEDSGTAKVTGQSDEDGYYELTFPDGSTGDGFNMVQNDLSISCEPGKQKKKRTDFELPQGIAMRSDGSYVVCNMIDMWNVTEQGDANKLPFQKNLMTPIAMMPTGDLVFVAVSGDICIYKTNGQTKKIASTLQGGTFTVVDITVDRLGQVVLFDQEQIEGEDLVRLGATEEYAYSHVLFQHSIRIVDVSKGTERKLTLVDKHGKPYKRSEAGEGFSVELGLPEGKICVDNNGNIVLASNQGIQILSNTGLGPGYPSSWI